MSITRRLYIENDLTYQETIDHLVKLLHLEPELKMITILLTTAHVLSVNNQNSRNLTLF